MNRLLIENVRFITPVQGQETGCIGIENGTVVCIGNRPEHVEAWQRISANGAWVISPFIDLHVHGMGGFGPEQATPQALLELSKVLARQGVQAFCPTLYCAKPAAMAALLRNLVPALGHEQGARIIGFHLEGPFISPDKPGVMKPQDIAPARVTDFEEMYQAAQGHISIVTLAPELPNIDPIIRLCHQYNIIVQAGHTNATYEQMQQAFDKGIKRVTHLANAMSGLHHRALGVLGAVLANPAISCEVIADGHHVHPALLTLLRQVKPISQITAVTDALLPTQQPQGPFYANAEEVYLDQQVWKRKTDGVMAGSALTMSSALKQLVHAGYSLPEASACTSLNAAAVLGISWAPSPQLNEPANFVLLSAQFDAEQVYQNGAALL